MSSISIHIPSQARIGRFALPDLPTTPQKTCNFTIKPSNTSEIRPQKFEIPSRECEMTSREREMASPKREMTSRNCEMPSPKREMTSRNCEMPSQEREMTSWNCEMLSPEREMTSRECEMPSFFSLFNSNTDNRELLTGNLHYKTND
jgi:hypothetical protein